MILYPKEEAAEFMAEHINRFAEKAFRELSNEARVLVLGMLGSPCSNCGALDEAWCCSDPSEP